MNTLKLKVLLILSNRQLHGSVGKALLIWSMANLIGCTILFLSGSFYLQTRSDFLTGLILSLIFSSPAVLIATWVVYALPDLSNRIARASVALASILLTSAGIIGLVAQFFQLPYLEVANVLYPFMLAAIACFFLIARKQVVSKKLY